eukprot:scaffold39982_cov39-Phaeocystis_antarctica.AAC.1
MPSRRSASATVASSWCGTTAIASPALDRVRVRSGSGPGSGQWSGSVVGSQGESGAARLELHAALGARGDN